MEGADVALLNAGGLRADLPAGELTYGALFEAIPFDNAIATLSVTGAELRAVLDALLAHSRGSPQVSGLRLAIVRCPGAARIRSVSLENSRPLEPGRLYRVATLDFLALGGDGLEPVVTRLARERVDLGQSREQNMRDALADYLSQRGGTLTAPPEGRVRLTWREACPR
jgi:5'-nucleotidase